MKWSADCFSNFVTLFFSAKSSIITLSQKLFFLSPSLTQYWGDCCLNMPTPHTKSTGACSMCCVHYFNCISFPGTSLLSWPCSGVSHQEHNQSSLLRQRSSLLSTWPARVLALTHNLWTESPSLINSNNTPCTSVPNAMTTQSRDFKYSLT